MLLSHTWATLQGMFGSKLKSPIGFKNIVKLVSKHGAPDEVSLYIMIILVIYLL